MSKINALDNLNVGHIIYFRDDIKQSERDSIPSYRPSKNFNPFIIAGMRAKVLEITDIPVNVKAALFSYEGEEPKKPSNNHTLTIGIENQLGIEQHWLALNNVTQKNVKVETETGFTFTIEYSSLVNLVDRITPNTEASKVLYAKS